MKYNTRIIFKNKIPNTRVQMNTNNEITSINPSQPEHEGDLCPFSDKCKNRVPRSYPLDATSSIGTHVCPSTVLTNPRLVCRL